jgi:hypothetical protein
MKAEESSEGLCEYAMDRPNRERFEFLKESTSAMIASGLSKTSAGSKNSARTPHRF